MIVLSLTNLPLALLPPMPLYGACPSCLSRTIDERRTGGAASLSSWQSPQQPWRPGLEPHGPLQHVAQWQ